MKFWRFWRSKVKRDPAEKPPTPHVEAPVQKKEAVPPEVAYLSDDSVARSLPLSSFVIMPPEQRR